MRVTTFHAPLEHRTVRVDDAQPKAIIAASCGIEPARLVEYKPLLDEAIELLNTILNDKGYAAVRTGRILRVVCTGHARISLCG